MTGALDGSYFVGQNAEKHRGLLKLSYPMQHGAVENWSDMEKVWQHLYQELRILPEEHSVLLTEAPLTPAKNRERTAEIFFETFNAPALFFSVQAVLALYASGGTTGVVLDSGDGVTHCIPVCEGFTMPHAVTRIDLAGRDITENLQLQLRKAGYPFHTSAEFEIIRTIKEKCCYVSFTPAKDADRKRSALDVQSFKLPDGDTIQLGVERFKAPEILFDPSQMGTEYMPVHEMLVTSIRKTDLDLRKQLYGSIYLSGGSTLFPGFGDRLLSEARKLSPKDIKLKIHAPPERKYTTWLGGSILTSLVAFKSMWVTAEQWKAEGGRVLHEKSFL
eukprot:TRINITY_DN68199_c5_g8_i1.p1 TRINITY_DN68199_c5_g8~~TRINITY_DN68199_c5_g8_i1.p1  ORF type:complete len:382 (-),score=9.81 TRINITY_DN68199_c5_g8_i1:85-1080(-)